jgi:hypothetical protein
MVFVARSLRYDLPDPVVCHLKRPGVFLADVPHDKPILVIGECAAYRVHGDWFVGHTAANRLPEPG